ncbi:DUF1028 domain-containing protein [Luteimonas gilva]|uniref:DUF1028 domain-containing protein n=1 Tax=Luteimonas gilva TaxID=2572684 RepID=A0A4U5K3F8_9GAMM|nr:DUF1028 domain-containing protein [Luteimonas gilva]TKR33529.1 DUF1028 domain-containing protein [Luteimonas gilva]
MTGPLAACRLAIGLLAACAISDAHATWSIVAANPRTGTIAVAAASCSGGVYGIQTVLPGKGAAIVQAASNNDAREAAVEMLRDGTPLDAILAKISDPASGYAPERQQYALLSLAAGARPLTYTGAAAPGAKGSVVGDRFSVQANTMASDAVVAKTAAALGRAEWPDDLAMARAVMRAMEAGAAAGGDRRCGKADSNTAFIGLYRKTDGQDAPWVELAINGIAPGAESGVARLRTLFQTWLRTGTMIGSTRTFVVP